MTRSNAKAEPSARNDATSSGVGGRPVRSNVARRIQVRRSAGGAGAIPGELDAAARKSSISLPVRAGSLTAGGGSRRTGWNAHQRRWAGVASKLAEVVVPTFD